MTSVIFEGKDIKLDEGETVLDGLLRSGENINFGCKAGACQACVMTATEGAIPPACQTGLSDNQKALNYFMSCQCKPASTLKVSKVDSASLIHSSTVLEKSWLNNKIIRLRLTVSNMDFKAGQYVTLWRNEQVGRSYSIASCPEDGYLECHIKVHQNGAFSHWAATELNVGDPLAIQGPMGLCFYQAEKIQPLFLASVSTGLAPIIGILKRALKNQHAADINLLVAAKHSEDLYLVDELTNIQAQHPQVKLHFLTQQGDSDISKIEDIYQYTKSQFTSFKDHKIYLCGADSFVKKMKKICFLNGASMSDIAADSFLAC